MELSRHGRNLAIGLVAALCLGFLLGGIETRPYSTATTLGLIVLIASSIGVVLNLASIALLFRKARARIASILAIVGSLLFFPTLLADQAGLYSSLPLTSGISAVELLMIPVLVAVLFLASRVYRESVKKLAIN